MAARRALSIALLVALASTFGGCPPLVLGSRFYRPAQAADAELFARGRRDVFPDDVRDGRAGGGPVVWVGIVSRLEEPRGEGLFRCRGVKSDGPQTEMTADANRLRAIPSLSAASCTCAASTSTCDRRCFTPPIAGTTAAAGSSSTTAATSECSAGPDRAPPAAE